MRILLTGGYGFIGSNLVRHLLGPEGMGVSHLVNLDKMTYAANPENLADLVDDPRHVPIQGDIGDEGLVTRLFVGRRTKGFKRDPDPQRRPLLSAVVDFDP